INGAPRAFPPHPGGARAYRGAVGGDSGAGDLSDRLERALDLVLGGVAQEAEAGRSAAPLEAEAVHDAERVVVAVPAEDAARGQLLADLAGCDAGQGEGERG